MTKFKLTAKVTISVHTEVEAKTLKEALKIADDRSIEESNWDGENKNDSWVSDEFDGEIFDVHNEE